MHRTSHSVSLVSPSTAIPCTGCARRERTGKSEKLGYQRMTQRPCRDSVDKAEDGQDGHVVGRVTLGVMLRVLMRMMHLEALLHMDE